MSDEETTNLGTWALQKSEALVDLKILRARRDHRISPRNGRTHPFVVLEIPDWVNIIALTPRGAVVMIRQWRAGVDRFTFEIPGGTIDPGEAPLEAARRELLEETGYMSEDWVDLGFVEPNPAIQNNRCWTFVARGAVRRQAQSFDEGEDIEVFERAPREVETWIDSGQITHALVVAAFAKLWRWQIDGDRGHDSEGA